MRKLAALVCLAVIGATSASAQIARPRAPAAPPSLSFSPTTGKVGFHMAAYNYIAQTPCQHTGVRSFAVTGALPPGLTPPDVGAGRLGFEGTPGQPGDWDAVVVAHGVACFDGGVEGAFIGDLTTRVHFHIDP